MNITDWIKFTGEVVWRAAGWNIPVDENERNFRFRLHGVVNLVIVVVVVLWTLLTNPTLLESVVHIITITDIPSVQLVINIIVVAGLMVFGVALIVLTAFSLGSIFGQLMPILDWVLATILKQIRRLAGYLRK